MLSQQIRLLCGLSLAPLACAETSLEVNNAQQQDNVTAESTLELNDNTQLIDTRPELQLVALAAEEVVFAQLDDVEVYGDDDGDDDDDGDGFRLRPGDIVVGEGQGGYARRVLEVRWVDDDEGDSAWYEALRDLDLSGIVEDDRDNDNDDDDDDDRDDPEGPEVEGFWVIRTEGASLASMVRTGTVEVAVRGEENCEADAFCFGTPEISIVDREVFMRTVDGATVRVVVKTGSVVLTPAVDFIFDQRSDGSRGMSARVAGTVTATLVVEIAANGAFQVNEIIDPTGPATLADLPFLFVLPTPVGPLPVAGAVQLDALIDIRGQLDGAGSVVLGVEGTTTVAIQADYDAGTWQTQPALDYLGTLSERTVTLQGAGDVDVALGPVVGLNLYGASTLRASLSPFVYGTFQLTEGALTSRIEGGLRGDLTVPPLLGANAPLFQRDFEVRTTLADWSP